MRRKIEFLPWEYIWTIFPFIIVCEDDDGDDGDGGDDVDDKAGNLGKELIGERLHRFHVTHQL